MDLGALEQQGNCLNLDYNQQSRGVAQPGSASALGAEGRGFESLRPDQLNLSKLDFSVEEIAKRISAVVMSASQP